VGSKSCIIMGMIRHTICSPPQSDYPLHFTILLAVISNIEIMTHCLLILTLLLYLLEVQQYVEYGSDVNSLICRNYDPLPAYFDVAIVFVFHTVYLFYTLFTAWYIHTYMVLIIIIVVIL
jgi:hypothetical protein